MYLGAVSAAFLERPLKEAARLLRELGLTHIEPGAGGHFPKHHCHPGALLADERALAAFQETLAEAELTISALAIHGQPLHPDPAIAEAYDRDFREACALAAKIGVTRLTLLAGLPEGLPGDRAPNWIVFPFPAAFVDMHRYQWEQRLIPYWKEHARIADDYGVRLCFEMVPGDMLHNPEALLRLRDAVGPTVGCNLDPSHLFWQGMDILEVVRALGEAIYHAHAKDSRLDPHVARVNGILDAKPFEDQEHRSWLFRTVGYGHDELFWREYVSALRLAGYDDVLSIEHEDITIDPQEGFALAAALLNRVLIRKPAGKVWVPE
jgi:sugar phosphate isomerase/epimerase